MSAVRFHAAPSARVTATRRRLRASALAGAPAHHAPSMRVRALRSCAIVAVALLAVALAGGFGGASGTGVLREASDLSIRSVGEGSPSFMSSAGTPTCQSDAPVSFEEELFTLDGRDDLRVDARAGIVGFTVEDPIDRAFAQLSSELEAKGWSRVGSGSSAYGTFVKSGGAYRWALASCVRSGTATCVVVQVVPLDEGA